MEGEIKRLKFLYRWLLKENLDYHFYLLGPEDKSFFVQLLSRRFNRARIPEDARQRLLELKEQGRIVWAVRNRSRLDFIFLNYLFYRTGLNPPVISANLPIWLFFSLSKLFKALLAYLVVRFNFLEQYAQRFWELVRARLEQGESMLVYLNNPPEVSLRYLHPERDPFYNLILWQEEEEEQNYIIVPLVIVFKKTPEREKRSIIDILFGPIDQPGALRRLYNYLTLSEEAIIEVADPVNIRHFLKRKDSQGLSRQMLAHRLRDHLFGHLEREKKIIIGPRLKPRSQLLSEVLQDPYLNLRLEEIAQSENRDLIEIKREATEYLNEMAANYNQRMVQLLDLILTWTWKNLYEGIEVDETSFSKIRQIAKKHPVVYVPSHKSHIDYLILSYVLYHKNFFPPHIVAGINLNFFPIGPVFRGAGAFFMRRKFKGNRVYSAVFSAYLKILLKESYPIEFFIEGGRSRTGRLLLPKLGVVKYLIRGWRELGLKDLYFVPVYIGYDQVIEQGEYLREITGQKKEKGNRFLTLLRSRQLIRQRYGKIYLNFGEPISLREYLERSGELVSEEVEGGYEKLGYQLVNEINRLTVVTPGSVVACGLLSSAKPARRAQELTQTFNWLHQYLVELGVRLSGSFERHPDWQNEALDFYQSRKLIEVSEDKEGGETLVSVPEEKRFYLEFYKNNIIHFFLPPAMTALILLRDKKQKEILADYTRLKAMFKYDFVFPPSESEEEEVRRSQRYFQNNGEKNELELKSFAGLIANFLESYLISLRTLLGITSPTTERDFLSRAQKVGEKLFQLREIERKEAISRLNFMGALRWFSAQKWLLEENDKIKLNSERVSEIENWLVWIISLLSGVRHF